MMSICPNCEAKLKVPDHLEKKIGQCPSCQDWFKFSESNYLQNEKSVKSLFNIDFLLLTIRGLEVICVLSATIGGLSATIGSFMYIFYAKLKFEKAENYYIFFIIAIILTAPLIIMSFLKDSHFLNKRQKLF